MTPDEARWMYLDQIEAHGETITIRRYSGTGTSRTYVDRSARARIAGYEPRELVGGITQGDRRVIVFAEDLEGESPPFVILKTDKVVTSRSGEISIVAVDDNTRRIAGELIAYDLQVRG